MASVIKGVGFFKLDDSDHNVGSLFSFDDVVEILHIVKLEEFHKFLMDNKIMDDSGYVDEQYMYRNKFFKPIKNYMNPEYTYSTNTSWDEYVICAIIRRTYPDAEIEQQSPVRINGRKHRIDVKLYVPSLSKHICLEIDGPLHFISHPDKDPRQRIEHIKQATGCEAYSWPFWIQRSSHNLKVLLGQESGGYGALWTSNRFFNYFCFQDSAKVIKDLSKPFDVEKDGGIGYFYEHNPHGVTKPEHYILNRIRQGKDKVDLLIPQGAKERNYWLPKEFQS